MSHFSLLENIVTVQWQGKWFPSRVANTAYSKNQNPYQKQFKRIKEKHLDNLYGCILYLKHIVET